MKKLLSITLILALIAATMITGVVSASAQTYDTTVKFGTSTFGAEIGDTFTCTVTLKSDKKLSAGQIEIPVDFSILSGDTAANLNANIETAAPNVSDTAQISRFDTPSKTGLVGYAMNFATAGSYDFSAGKKILNLTFTVIKAGTVTIKPILREFLDADLNDLIDINGNPVSGSVTATVTVSSHYAVDAPVVSEFESLENGLQFRWAACDGAGKYRVFKKADDRWAVLGDTIDTKFVDPDVVPGTQYTYTVRCMNAQGTAFVSTYNKTGFSAYYLTTPAITSLTNTLTGVSVAWENMNGAEKFRLFRKGSDVDTGWYMIADTDKTSYIDPVVTSGVTYSYTVRCISADGSRYTSPYLVDEKSIFYVAPPVLTKVENAAKGVSLAWTVSDGAEKVRVFRKTGSGKWTKLIDTDALTYTDTAVKSGTTYSYTVRCIKADGSAFTSAADMTGKKIAYIAAPAVKSVANKLGYVNVSFNKPAGAVKIRVFRKLGSGKWTKLGDTTSTSYKDKKAVSGKTYTYGVRCVSADGKTFTSALGTTKKIQYVAAPALVSAVKSGKAVKFTWKKTAGAKKYRVMRKVGTGKWTKLADTKTTSYLDKKVAKNKKYTYSVCCLDAKGKVVSAYNTTGKAILYK